MAERSGSGEDMGAALSAGYGAAFPVLAAIAALGFALYLALMPETFGYEPAAAGGAGGQTPAAVPAE
jgi:hypothetical protein